MMIVYDMIHKDYMHNHLMQLIEMGNMFQINWFLEIEMVMIQIVQIAMINCPQMLMMQLSDDDDSDNSD